MEKGGWIAIVAFTAVCLLALFFGLKCLLLQAAIEQIAADQSIGYSMHITVDGQDTLIWFKTKKIVVDNEFTLENGDGSLYTHLSKGVILDIKPIK
jgi:hypothetical protein